MPVRSLNLSRSHPAHLILKHPKLTQVIEEVMQRERAAMEQKVSYIEHFLGMQEEQKERRDALRQGKRKKKPPAAKKGDEETAGDDNAGDDDDDDDLNPDARPRDIEQGGAQPLACTAAVVTSSTSLAGPSGAVPESGDDVTDARQAEEVQIEIDALRSQREVAAPAPA